MNQNHPRSATGAITWRLWTVVILFGALAALLLYLQIPAVIGGSLATIASLTAPIAIIMTVAWILGLPARVIPKVILWLGVVGCVVGVGGLIMSPGQPVLIVVFALGVWLLLVGLIASLVVAPKV
ncbi:hypothetical protein QP027_09745 [Corynebacterium breve]|uniref:Uncharacterized protein n=1 Tax=Corynebacterium breve TaxID=3049799 RepID=A0ABY8VF38_9CORY|nr:hypothetical protein [Corynebacterium breve]WIM67375.1 hypothetical protein QP027_09745 [Corynebacterium breve]